MRYIALIDDSEDIGYGQCLKQHEQMHFWNGRVDVSMWHLRRFGLCAHGAVDALKWRNYFSRLAKSLGAIHCLMTFYQWLDRNSVLDCSKSGSSVLTMHFLVLSSGGALGLAVFGNKVRCSYDWVVWKMEIILLSRILSLFLRWLGQDFLDWDRFSALSTAEPL